MRRMVWSLMSVTALALAGCGGSGSPSQDGSAQQSAPAAAQQPANIVSGTVALRDGSQPSADAKLTISLVDVSAPDSAPLATKTLAPTGQFPVSFELNFNPADVNPADIYVVKADLIDGERHYAMPLQAPVLTKGAPSQASIQLTAEQTPAEKELADFLGVQKQIGGMKIASGSKLDKDVSRAWQVFRNGGAVRLVRMQADYGDKGFTSTDYAYQDGAPWVVVQQKKASQGAKPDTILRAGWDKDGNLLLKQSEAGGKTDMLSDADAADLKKQAQEVLNMVTGGKGK